MSDISTTYDPLTMLLPTLVTDMRVTVKKSGSEICFNRCW